MAEKKRPIAHLLVVDDEPEILELVVAYLRRRGEIVIAASSYEQAWGMVNDHSQDIDVLITDGRMPGGSGANLIRAALRRPGEQCRCILMTGAIEIDEDMEAFGVRVIFKPFSFSTLYRQVCLALGGVIDMDSAPDAKPEEAPDHHGAVLRLALDVCFMAHLEGALTNAVRLLGPSDAESRKAREEEAAWLVADKALADYRMKLGPA